MTEIENYLASIDEDRRDAFLQLYEVVKDNMPEGFEERMQYGMITWVVPLAVYPDGYLNREDEPVPFISVGYQKKHLAVYHMGIMGNKPLLQWFEDTYAEVVPTKLNMGKSCIRFTNAKKVPFDLIGELVQKMSMDEWVKAYDHFAGKRNRK